MILACRWNKKNFILTLLLVFACQPLLFAAVDRSQKLIEYARKKTGRKIVCSPGGKVPGTITYEQALKKLSSGMILQMYPGFYNSKELVIFRKDNLIIEGIGAGYVNTPIIMYGKKCIVRNVYARGISGGNITIIDSKAHGITILAGKAGKTIVANCAMNSLSLYANTQDILIKNCTILRAYKVKNVGKASQSWTYYTHRTGRYSLIGFGQMLKKGKVKFENCILYSGENLFYRPSTFIGLTMQNNIIHCERSLIPVSEKKTPIRSFTLLKDKFVLKLKKKKFQRTSGKMKKATEANFIEKPLFKKAPSLVSWWDLSRDNFILLPNSPGYGQGIGVNMGSKGIPVPPVKDKK
jgi:hypothetical protein